MSVALMLLALQGALGAFDTIYYHEIRAKLPAGGPSTRAELALHGTRSLIYAALFATLQSVAWGGALAWLLGFLIAAEISITMCDFAIEYRTRGKVGVLPGERVTHGVMAVLYGAILAHLLPVVCGWLDRPTGFTPVDYALPSLLRWTLSALALGVLVSGLRDVYAAWGGPGSGFPWDDRR